MTTSSADDDSATTPAPEPVAQPATDTDGNGEGAGHRDGKRNSAAILALTLAVISAVVTAVVTPLGDRLMEPFFEEPTCPGEACDGKNPENQGCGEDARTFKPGGGNPALLQLRYSEQCRAVWAKIERGSPGDRVTVHVTGGAKRTAEIEYGNDQFTGMVSVKDGDFRVTACAIPKTAPKSGSTGGYEHYCIHGTEATAWQ